MSNNLKSIRMSRNLTQAALAKACGINTLSYQRYELEERTPNVRTAIRIADALGISDIRILWGGNPTS